MSNEICFFSRDLRTHRLFRSNWHIAAQQCGFGTRVVCRGFGLTNALVALCRFIRMAIYPRVIFGTSEVCLYAMFSRRQDIWVFTGLGRLLIDKGVVAQVVRIFLRVIYRGQRLVVLNEQDRDVIRNVIGGLPALIEGEGYKFNTWSDTTIKSPDKLTFAYVGRLLKSKGVNELVSSFARHSQPHWTLLVIGDSDFGNRDSVSTREFSQLIKNSKGKISFTGFRPDVRSLLAGVDVLVSLSHREGLPFSILDGIDAGTHIVLSPVPGHLSFKGMPGITFVEPDGIGRFFDDISKNSALYLKFNRSGRLASCKARFGDHAVTESIKTLLIASSTEPALSARNTIL